jgi:uncharacterized membrane protein YqjE
MELIGGMTIMLVLLGLIAAAVLISLPILVWGLNRRIVLALTVLIRVEEQIERIEQQIANQQVSATQSAVTLDR